MFVFRQEFEQFKSEIVVQLLIYTIIFTLQFQFFSTALESSFRNFQSKYIVSILLVDPCRSSALLENALSVRPKAS